MASIKDPNAPTSEPKTQLNEIDTLASFRHVNRSKWELGVAYMLDIAQLDLVEPSDKHLVLVHQAQYNVGKAYFQGFGVRRQSDDEAEKWWLRAAHDGSAYGSVSAMTALGFFYSRRGEPEYFDLARAFYWHSEACGNGSLESQG